MHSHFLIAILQYFDLCGFCTEYNVILSKKCTNQYAILIFFIHIINILVICVILYPFLVDPIAKFETIARTNDYTKFAGLVLTYVLSINESICNRRSQRHIWTLFMQNQRETSLRKKLNLLRRLQRRSLIYFFVSFCAAVRFTFKFFVDWKISHAHFWLTFYVLIFMQRTRIFYNFLYYDIILEELESINALINGVKFSKKIKISKKKRIVKQIRYSYQTIQLMVDNLNDVFGWSHFITIICYFVLVVCELDYFYWCFVEGIPVSVVGN